MSEKFSRNLMTAELLLIVLPLSILWLLAAIQLVSIVETGVWQVSAALFALLLMAAPMLALAVLAIRFAQAGTERLKAVPDLWWVMATLGGGVALAGIAAGIVYLATDEDITNFVANYITGTPIPDDSFGLTTYTGATIDVGSRAAVFSPVLIPLVHLWLERNRKQSIQTP